jgi:hypothetical protein
LGSDNLQDMAIEVVVGETLGRVDPTRVATNALRKEANKQIKKRNGSFYKMGGSFKKMGGGVKSVERYEYQGTTRI